LGFKVLGGRKETWVLGFLGKNRALGFWVFGKNRDLGFTRLLGEEKRLGF
jgi:hypothetical protein